MYGYLGLCEAMLGYVGLCRAVYGCVWPCRADVVLCEAMLLHSIVYAPRK